MLTRIRCVPSAAASSPSTLRTSLLTYSSSQCTCVAQKTHASADSKAYPAALTHTWQRAPHQPISLTPHLPLPSPSIAQPNSCSVYFSCVPATGLGESSPCESSGTAVARACCKCRSRPDMPAHPGASGPLSTACPSGCGGLRAHIQAVSRDTAFQLPHKSQRSVTQHRRSTGHLHILTAPCARATCSVQA